MRSKSPVEIGFAVFALFAVAAGCKRNPPPAASEAQGNGPLSSYRTPESKVAFQIRDSGFDAPCDLNQTDEKGLPRNCNAAHMCSGILVDDSRLHSAAVGLTAAHCSSESTGAFAYFPAFRKTLAIRKFVPHPLFTGSNFWFLNHLDHLIGNAPLPTKKVNYDISLVLFDPVQISDLPGVRINMNAPGMPQIPSAVRDRQLKNFANSREGVTSTHLGFDLSVYSEFPKITVMGFGFENFVWTSQIRRVNFPKEICQMFAANKNGTQYRWNDAIGCAAINEADVPVKGAGPEGNLRENYGRLAAFSFPMATAVFVPPMESPKNSPCRGDSGGPLVVDGVPGVFGVVNGGPGLCAGTISSYTIVAPHVEALKKALAASK